MAVDLILMQVDTFAVRRIVGIILLLVFAATCSGWLKYLHLREHLKSVSPEGIFLHADDEDGHNEANCPVCLTLAMPMAITGYVPLLIVLGLLLACLKLPHVQIVAHHAPVWVESRGPPVL